MVGLYRPVLARPRSRTRLRPRLPRPHRLDVRSLDRLLAPLSDHSTVGSFASARFLPRAASRKAQRLSLEDGPLFFVGIDWATTEHAVRVLDRTGRKVAAFTIEHAAAGFTRLNKLGDTKSTPVAIERPDWLLIGALLEAGTR